MNVSRLPNIVQLVDSLKKAESKRMSEMGGWENYSSPLSGRLIPSDYINNPYHSFCNNGEDFQFVTSRTASGRMTLTPNLRNRPFIYRGQSKEFPSILCGFELEDSEGKLKNNLLVEDFIALLRSHPIFMMFDHGIKLDGYKDRFYFNMNYYGLGQHYNFKTGLLDFTSDIDVAAFFACTKNLGNDTYEPIKSVSPNSFGVIYVHEIKPDITFKMVGFTTIGLQLYPRTGAQRGLVFNQDGRFPPIEKLVTPLYFKHDYMASKHVFEKMNSGKALFPEDSLSGIAQDILTSNEVSGETFALNLYSNSEDYSTNLKRLEKLNMKVNWHKRMIFTPDLLKPFYDDIRNGYWEQFCKTIYFGGKNDSELREQMLQLPKDEHYRQFFELEEWERLQAYNYDLIRRSKRNALSVNFAPK